MTAVGPSYRQPFHRNLLAAIRETLRPPKQSMTRTRRQVSRPAGFKSQYWIIGIVLALNIIGLAMILSAGSVVATYEGQSTWFYFQRQGIWFLLGVLAMAVISKMDYRIIG
ncbi:MAG: FtsW/RodA/SpoVE family cell cycle protein, partial [Actinomycetota bacterium]|nr:FtsW/RodA/SpoVE family cell cycle protein [Actinomycetota bacterium]